MNYVVNAKSMVFLPSFNAYGEPNTIVVEEAATYTIPQKTYDVIDQGAKYYGTTIKTTKEIVKDIFGKINMAPVIIYAPQLLVFFPTQAFKDDLCAWFNAFGIKGVYSLSKNRCCVLLKNGRFIELNMSATLFKKRFHQALSIIGLLFVRFHQLEHEMTYTGQKVLYRLSEERLGYEAVTHKQGEGRFE